MNEAGMKRTAQLTVLGFALLAGCEEEVVSNVPPAPVRTASPQAAVDSAAANAPEAGETFTYQYTPVAKRDPFRAPQRTGTTLNELCKEPLCQFDLDQLTLVAVVTGMANPFAMVEDTEGRGHIIRRNSRIGRQGGRVSQILRDAVVVSETWTTPDGKQISNPVSMQLKADRILDPDLDLQTGQNR